MMKVAYNITSAIAIEILRCDFGQSHKTLY